MSPQRVRKFAPARATGTLAATLLTSTLAVAGEPGRDVLVLTSTNNPSGNEVVVFKLDTAGTSWLSWESTLPTHGNAVIYSAGGNGYVSVFAVDAYGDLTPAATSSPIGVAGFNGVAISE
jgi:hypothetical protein